MKIKHLNHYRKWSPDYYRNLAGFPRDSHNPARFQYDAHVVNIDQKTLKKSINWSVCAILLSRRTNIMNDYKFSGFIIYSLKGTEANGAGQSRHFYCRRLYTFSGHNGKWEGRLRHLPQLPRWNSKPEFYNILAFTSI